MPLLDGAVLVPNLDAFDGGMSSIFGGRLNVKMPRRKPGYRTLAFMGTTADLQAAVTGTTDVTDIDTELTRALVGPSVLQYSETGNGNTRTFTPASALAVPVNVTGGVIGFWHKDIAGLSGSSSIDRFNIELHSAGTPASPTGNYHSLDANNAPVDFRRWTTSTTLHQGHWQRYGVAVPQFTAVGTGADLTQIIFARLVIRFLSGITGTIQFGTIDFEPGETKAKGVISLDDAFGTQFTVIAADLIKRGFPATLYPGAFANMTKGTPGSALSMSRRQMQTLHDNHGWQIGSQAWATEDNTIIDPLTPDQQMALYAKERAYRNAVGVADYGDGSYYTLVSHLDDLAWEAFRRMNRSMRGAFDGNNANPPFLYGETLPIADPMLIRSLNIGTTTWGANVGSRLQAHVDQAIANKGCAFVHVHFEAAIAGNVRTGWLSFLDYLAAHQSDIDMVTTRDLFEGAA